MTHLLLVDDDETFLTTLGRMLSQHGLRITLCESVVTAQAHIERHTFTHALVDLNLHGDSGLKLLDFLMTRQPHCRVVMLTGYASIATSVKAIKTGALDYLCKPASLPDILQALQLQAEPQTTNNTATDSFERLSPKRLEWEHIQRTLNAHQGNISATARALNMHRRTLQRKLQKRPVIK